MDVSPQRTAVIGAGYVGLTTGACLASLGHHVVCVDVDEAKIARLRQGRVDILEPDLPELVAAGLTDGHLDFTGDVTTAVRAAEVVFLCLPTPMAADGRADLSAVESVVAELGPSLPTGCVVVNKSTVPVGTAAWVRRMLDRDDLAVVSNPEFLREGSAVQDFLNPDRIVVGSDDEDAARRVADLYRPLRAPVVRTDAASAEMIKYAANCFLAVKLSYVNAIAELCEVFGADVDAVTTGMGHDPRIGRAFLRPGPGWGGPCLPKDSSALLRMADTAGVRFDLLQAAVDDNTRQGERVVRRLAEELGSLHRARIGLLGLAFKAGTNDLRGSPALRSAELLVAAGAEVTAYDPAVSLDLHHIAVVDDAYQAVKEADAVLLATEWPEFRALDWTAIAELMNGTLVFDARNHLDPAAIDEAGLTWRGIGRMVTAGSPDRRTPSTKGERSERTA
ncbi:UDP-glucose 6-dehydrogenase [Saccharopolyspora subtropica]|uniref:UDP-glucose 6-dehydrogenase n=1 Tax=Saccharopolyspora thermophila TaxID=89367 RepID=A0A917JPP2_9PSEU|nr:UDP-glucose/GDP-mannose dehydrogenase family protein [Saccharopolyspora subtropica]GGI80631.1 UDP-glucose 6-dehydrogenase [Saccharopolyspora subtropica]